MAKVTTQQIKEAVSKAVAGSRKLKIGGYVNSAGDVTDFVVELLPEDGYANLIKEALVGIAEGSLSTLPPEGFQDKEAWSKGVDEQILSWTKSAAGTQPSRQGGGIVSSTGPGYSIFEDKPDVVAVFHARSLEAVKRVVTPNEPTKSAAKTIAKSILRDRSPLGAYIGRLNLSSDKLESIEAI